jgi:hypothetical protein
LAPRKGFELVNVLKGEHREIISMDCEPSDVQVKYIKSAQFD